MISYFVDGHLPAKFQLATRPASTIFPGSVRFFPIQFRGPCGGERAARPLTFGGFPLVTGPTRGRQTDEPAVARGTRARGLLYICVSTYVCIYLVLSLYCALATLEGEICMTHE